MAKENLLGRKFARLLVIAEAPPSNGRTAWKCQCDCSVVKIVRAENLKDSSTKSCGCLNDEKRSARAKKMYSVRIKYHPTIASARQVWKRRYKDGELLFEDFYRMSQMPCYYCGIEPDNRQNTASQDGDASRFAKEEGLFVYNGLDRIDNSLPHTLGNVVPCCKYCNYAKRERTVQQFEEWIKKLYQTLQKRKKNIKK
jgi:hypothetical protein